MSNWKNFIDINDNQIIILRSQSNLIATNWEFEYIDLTSEFQFILIKFLKIKEKCTLQEVEDLFGLPPSVANQFFKRIEDLKIITHSNDYFMLTKFGKSVNTHDQIIEKEQIFMAVEIDSNTQIFIGKDFQFYNLKDSKDIDLTHILDLDDLVNKPTNLISFENNGRMIRKFSTNLIKSDNSYWLIQSDSGMSIKLQGSNSIINRYDEIMQTNSSISRWLENCNLSRNGFVIQKFDDENGMLLILAENFTDLNKNIMYKRHHTFFIRLTHKEEQNLDIIQTVKVGSEDKTCSVWILLLILDNMDTNFWYLDEGEIVSEIKNMWFDIYQGDTDEVLSLDDLLINASENNMPNLAKKIRIGRDLFD